MGPKIIGVMTWNFLTWRHQLNDQQFATYHCLYWRSIGTKRLSPAVLRILGTKRIRVTTFTVQGNVTSSVTWPFDSQVAISYRCSIDTKSVSPAVVEIMCPKNIGVMTSLVSWPFPVGGPLEPSLYLQSFSRYRALSILGSRSWPFRSRDAIGHVTIRFPGSHFL